MIRWDINSVGPGVAYISAKYLTYCSSKFNQSCREVTENSVNIRSGPCTWYSAIARVNTGDKLEYLNWQGKETKCEDGRTYAAIDTEGGGIGFVYAGDLAVCNAKTTTILGTCVADDKSNWMHGTYRCKGSNEYYETCNYDDTWKAGACGVNEVCIQDGPGLGGITCNNALSPCGQGSETYKMLLSATNSCPHLEDKKHRRIIASRILFVAMPYIGGDKITVEKKESLLQSFSTTWPKIFSDQQKCVCAMKNIASIYCTMLNTDIIFEHINKAISLYSNVKDLTEGLRAIGEQFENTQILQKTSQSLIPEQYALEYLTDMVASASSNFWDQSRNLLSTIVSINILEMSLRSLADCNKVNENIVKEFSYSYFHSSSFQTPVYWFSSKYDLSEEQHNVDGKCGFAIGVCASELCCSSQNWCGDSDDHCLLNKGCQEQYGKCTHIKSSLAQGNCGPNIGSCASGLCCSSQNWCGDSDDHCLLNKGCQEQYGKCTHIKSSLAQGNCGPDIGSCASGLCCSSQNWCGDSEDHCLLIKGCQEGYGKCTHLKTFLAQGNCGPDIGSCTSGLCCSKWGWCGTTSDYCGINCQKEFGTCTSTFTFGSRCGLDVGSCAPGLCCSKWGWCGVTSAHCKLECKKEFGICFETTTIETLSVSLLTSLITWKTSAIVFTTTSKSTVEPTLTSLATWKTSTISNIFTTTSQSTAEPTLTSLISNTFTITSKSTENPVLSSVSIKTGTTLTTTMIVENMARFFFR
jgi:hypothetical protein